jgi:hypothetical protein
MVPPYNEFYIFFHPPPFPNRRGVIVVVIVITRILLKVALNTITLALAQLPEDDPLERILHAI